MNKLETREVFRRIFGDKYLTCSAYLKALENGREPDYCSGWADRTEKSGCENCSLFVEDYEKKKLSGVVI